MKKLLLILLTSIPTVFLFGSDSGFEEFLRQARSFRQLDNYTGKPTPPSYKPNPMSKKEIAEFNAVRQRACQDAWDKARALALSESDRETLSQATGAEYDRTMRALHAEVTTNQPLDKKAIEAENTRRQATEKRLKNLSTQTRSEIAERDKKAKEATDQRMKSERARIEAEAERAKAWQRNYRQEQAAAAAFKKTKGRLLAGTGLLTTFGASFYLFKQQQKDKK